MPKIEELQGDKKFVHYIFCFFNDWTRIIFEVLHVKVRQKAQFFGWYMQLKIMIEKCTQKGRFRNSSHEVWIAPFLKLLIEFCNILTAYASSRFRFDKSASMGEPARLNEARFFKSPPSFSSS